MACSIFPFLSLLLLTFSSFSVQSHEEGHITAEISNRGLHFLKDLLIEKVVSSLVPLELPKIEKFVKEPILGGVHMVLSNITIERIHVPSSTLRTEDCGIVIDVAGATANLSLNWRYLYSTWLLPLPIAGGGSASVEVKGLDVGLTLSLKTVRGYLKLSLLECRCYVKDISIKLDGGVSWLFQGLVDAFECKITSAIEHAVSKKIRESIVKLDSVLQSLLRDVPVTNIAALNVTLVDDPELSDSILHLEINGLFSAKDEATFSSQYRRSLQASVSCTDTEKMAKMSLHEDVLRSASSVYFEAGEMHWVVDKIPDQSLLNTAGWRFIIPQLYKRYPNYDMNLNLSVSSPSMIAVEQQQIRATIPLDMVIDVLNEDEVIPVICISMVINTSVSPEISRNILAGTVKLNDFTMSLSWSKVGDLHVHLIQTLISTTLKTLILPYVNLKLKKGFQLPVFHGYKLQDPAILFTDSWIVICSDVTST